MRTEKLQCLRGEAAICSARLLSVSRHVGAHLWREGPVGGLPWDSNPQPLNTCLSRGTGSTAELSPTPFLNRLHPPTLTFILAISLILGKG